MKTDQDIRDIVARRHNLAVDLTKIFASRSDIPPEKVVSIAFNSANELMARIEDETCIVERNLEATGPDDYLNDYEERAMRLSAFMNSVLLSAKNPRVRRSA